MNKPKSKEELERIKMNAVKILYHVANHFENNLTLTMNEFNAIIFTIVPELEGKK